MVLFVSVSSPFCFFPFIHWRHLLTYHHHAIINKYNERLQLIQKGNAHIGKDCRQKSQSPGGEAKNLLRNM